MNNAVLIIVAGLISIVLLGWGFKILTVTKPAGKIEGVVVDKTDTTITIKTPDGSKEEIPVTDFKVGEEVKIIMYKSKLTGKTEYRFFKVKFHGVAGE